MKRRPSLLALSLALVGLFATGCHKAPAPDDATGPAISSLGHLSRELDRLQSDVQTKNKEIAGLLKRYQDEGGQLPENFGPDLTDEQRRILAQRFQQERLGLKVLLQDILDRDQEIGALKTHIAKLEDELPSSTVVKKGDRHDQILLAALKARGVEDAEAARLVRQVNLQDPLLPGYRVWTYMKDGIFGTWVTADDGPTSPQDAARHAWGQLTAQRDAARREASSLKRALSVAESERSELQKQIEVLRDDIGDWSQQVEQARQEARASKQAARYVAGSRQQLRERGVLSGGFLHGTSVRRLESLETLDLSATNEITLRGSEHGLARIQKVKLLPDGFRRDQDYAVDLLQGGRMARVSLLDVDKFKRSTFVVVLE